MKKRGKGAEPLRTKVCILASGLIVILICAFSIYASLDGTKLPNPDSNLWGLLCLGILAGDYAWIGRVLSDKGRKH